MNGDWLQKAPRYEIFATPPDSPQAQLALRLLDTLALRSEAWVPKPDTPMANCKHDDVLGTGMRDPRLRQRSDKLKGVIVEGLVGGEAGLVVDDVALVLAQRTQHHL